MLARGIIQREARPPAVPILIIRRLRIDQHRLFRRPIPITGRLALCIGKNRKRGALGRLVNAAVHFVAQSVADAEVRRCFPRVLKVKVVRLAANSCLVELAADGRETRRRNGVVRIRCRSQQPGESVR